MAERKRDPSRPLYGQSGGQVQGQGEQGARELGSGGASGERRSSDALLQHAKANAKRSECVGGVWAVRESVRSGVQRSSKSQV